MFGFLKNKAINVALNTIKGVIMNPNFEGIGTVKEIKYEDKKIFLTVILKGLEEKPIDITCEDIKIGDDGSYIIVEKFVSNMPFVENALNQFGVRKFEIPEGAGRLGMKSAKSILKL